MSFLGRLEQTIEEAVSSLFGRGRLRGTHPVEIGRRLLRAMEDERRVSVSRVYVPNCYSVFMHPSEVKRIRPLERTLSVELSGYIEHHARRHGYSFVGARKISFVGEPSLKTGEIRVVPSFVEDCAIEGRTIEGRAIESRNVEGAIEGRAIDGRDIQGHTVEGTVEGRTIDGQAIERAAAGRAVDARAIERATEGRAFDGHTAGGGGRADDADTRNACRAESTQRFERGPETRIDPVPGPESHPGNCQPRLVVLSGDAAKREYLLRGREVTIGRARANDIILSDPGVSREHASISLVQGSFILRDLDSVNGTYVNDRRIGEHMLRDGDLIRVGNALLKFYA